MPVPTNPYIAGNPVGNSPAFVGREDVLREVLRIPRSVTEPPPSIAGSVNEEYITGVGKLEDRLLILLDLEKVLGAEAKAA